MRFGIGFLGVVLVGIVGVTPVFAGQLLVNGDFEAGPILGPGQSAVGVGQLKWTTTGSTGPWYNNSISGVVGWNYATPEWNGTHTDVGLAHVDSSFGRPSSGQSLFNNRWDKLVSQTVSPTLHTGDVLTATVEFGTRGYSTDKGRAGYFYLVAGTVDPLNPEQFAPGSIILDSMSVANPTWTNFVPDVIAVEYQYNFLRLDYTFAENDPALSMPITVGMRLAVGSVGTAFWDNALLTTGSLPDSNPNPNPQPDPTPAPTPEPATVLLAMAGLVTVGGHKALSKGWAGRRILSNRRSHRCPVSRSPVSGSTRLPATPSVLKSRSDKHRHQESEGH